MSPWIDVDVGERDAELVSTICDHDVAWPWPWADEPVITVAVPVGCTRTIDDSQPPAPTPSACVTADGARPQIST